MKSPMHFKPSIPGSLLRILGVVVVAALLIGAVLQIRPAGNAQATSPSTCTSKASGNWNDGANWTCTGGASFPDSGDTAVIDGQAIDLSANQSVKDVSISDTATLTIPAPFTLTVGGTLDVASPANLQSVFSSETDTEPTSGGTVAFGPNGNQTLKTNGTSLMFWNLTKTGSGQLAVNPCSAQSTCEGGFEVFNTLTLTGADPALVSLRSSMDGLSWRMLADKANVASFVDVKDSHNEGVDIVVTDGINSGNNIGWQFTGLSSSLNPSPVEQEVTLTMVLPVGATETELTFMDGLVKVACINSEGTTVNPVPVVNGVATCVVDELAAGIHTITVAYSGGPASIIQTVVTETNLDIHSSKVPSAKGEQVTFTAAIMPDTVAGSVAFKDNGVLISGCETVAVDLTVDASNVRIHPNPAICKTTLDTAGPHTITAAFVPSGTDTQASLSGPLVQSVKNLTSVAVASSNNKVNHFQKVTLTATLNAAAGGTVTFMENGNLIAGCSNVAVVGTTAACDVSSLQPGKHNITVFYSGDASNFNSTSPAIVQQINSVFYMPMIGK